MGIRDYFRIDPRLLELADKAEERCAGCFAEIDRNARDNAARILSAFAENRVSEACFAGSTGYGYGDLGRDTLDKVWAQVMGTEDAPCDHMYDVVGSLCENNDKFAIDRMLPKIDRGDLLVIHDTGAHGHAMGYNYNGKLRSAELLLKENGSVELIRRAETMEDYFATLIW